uniref:Reverse transcriptase domain-containing protein n=1 Tax=Erpetoichthys calabaricus TaxID=27687 RepID=A0A8C4SNG4_ERPCA
MKEVWDGMKIITGCSSKQGATIERDVKRANQMNNFFNRFDHPNPLSLSPQSIAPSTHPSADTSIGETSPPIITTAQVSRELRRLRASKAAGPDGVSPRLLKVCALELGGPLQRIFNLSLEQGRVLRLWKTSCITPVPKVSRPSELNDFRPVALTSHVMKTMERLLLHHLRPQALDPLQFAYQEKVGAEDAIIYMLHRSLSHLDRGSGAVRIMILDFSSAFNTIQPLLLRDKLTEMGVDSYLVAWIVDYLKDRPQYVRLGNCTSDIVVSNTEAPQGTVLSPVLFSLYTSDFQYNSESCHVQKFADNTAYVGCIRSGQEEEYRNLIKDFVKWCDSNHLHLNTSKTKELVVDFRRPRPLMDPVIIRGDCVQMVQTYKYLGVQLDDKLDWTANTDALCKKGQSRLYFLRRLASFNICNKMLQMFYQTVVASALFYAVVCWGGSITKKDASLLDKLVRKAGSIVGMELNSLTSVAERRALSRLLSIMENPLHPLNCVISRQKSSFSDRLLSLSCST